MVVKVVCRLGEDQSSCMIKYIEAVCKLNQEIQNLKGSYGFKIT